jgi:hypothetical protein
VAAVRGHVALNLVAPVAVLRVVLGKISALEEQAHITLVDLVDLLQVVLRQIRQVRVVLDLVVMLKLPIMAVAAAVAGMAPVVLTRAAAAAVRLISAARV